MTRPPTLGPVSNRTFYLVILTLIAGVVASCLGAFR